MTSSYFWDWDWGDARFVMWKIFWKTGLRNINLFEGALVLSLVLCLEVSVLSCCERFVREGFRHGCFDYIDVWWQGLICLIGWRVFLFVGFGLVEDDWVGTAHCTLTPFLSFKSFCQRRVSHGSTCAFFEFQLCVRARGHFDFCLSLRFIGCSFWWVCF